jgi:hypothetical protein
MVNYCVNLLGLAVKKRGTHKKYLVISCGDLWVFSSVLSVDRRIFPCDAVSTTIPKKNDS